MHLQNKIWQTTLATLPSVASGEGQVEVVRLLLDSAADINLAENDGITALSAASDHGHVEICRLLRAAADESSTNKRTCDIELSTSKRPR